MNDSRQKLYDALSENYDLGTFEEFNQKIDNEDSRKKLYDAVQNDFDLGSYEEYSSKLGFGSTPAPADTLGTTTIQAAPMEEVKQPRRGFKAGAQESWKGLSAGAQFAYGEVANAITGSSQDDANALYELDNMLKEGKDVDAELDKAWTNAGIELRTGALEFLPGWAIKGLKQRVHDKAENSRVLNDIREAIGEANGDVAKAREILAARAQEKSYGDIQKEKAQEKFGTIEETEGFGAWVGENAIQMIPSASALIVGALTKSPAAARAIGMIGMGGMTAATSGSSMYEARESGASDYETHKVGVVDGAIEYITEKLPFDNYTNWMVGKAKSKVTRDLAKALKGNSAMKGELEDLLKAANKELGGKLFSKKSLSAYVADMLAEGASEFTAEATQTMTKLLYEDAEMFPLLSEAVGNGMQGALAGFFMGAVLGGASKTMEHHQNKQRRKDQGYVDVAVVNFGTAEKPAYDVVEILSVSDDTNLATVLQDGAVVEVNKNAIGQGYRYSYEEFEAGRMKVLESEAIENGAVTKGMILAADDRAVAAESALAEALRNEGFNDEEIITLIEKAAADRQEIFASDELAGAYEDYREAVKRSRQLRVASANQAQYERGLKRLEIEEKAGEFWRDNKTEDANGNPIFNPTVETGLLQDGTRVYILSDVNEAGECAAVTENGEKKVIKADMLQDGTQIATLDDYLQSLVDADKSTREQTRMAEQTQQRVNDTKAQALPGTSINFGTAEDPRMGTIMQNTPDGAVVQMEDGSVRRVTWDELANTLNIGSQVLTDEEIAGVEAADILGAESAFKGQIATSATEIGEAAEETTIAAETMEQFSPLPTKADGTVDQNALWNQDPERWAEWNDEQKQDGGANSLAYINGAIAKESARIAELQAQYAVESDFDTRDAIDREVATIRERLEQLIALQQKYAVPIVETTEAAPEATIEAAPEAAVETPMVEEVNPVKQTLRDLYNDPELSESEIEDYINANVQESQKVLDKHLGKAPKMGTDMAKYKAEKAKHQEKTAELEKQRDFWREVQSYIEVPTSEMDMEPQNALEFTAKELTRKDGVKLQRDSFTRHTGYGSEAGNFLSMLRTKQNGGLTLEEAGERLMEMDRENGTGFFDQSDPNAGLNAILEVIGGARTSGDVSGYIKANREQMAREEVAAARNAMMEEMVQPEVEIVDNLEEDLPEDIFYSISETTGSGTTENVKAWADAWSKRLGIAVTVLDNVNDVTDAAARNAIAGGAKVAGWFNAEDGKVYIYAPNASTAEEVSKTFIHEVVSHKGLRGLLGKKGFNDLCDLVWSAMSPEVKAKYLTYENVLTKARLAEYNANPEAFEPTAKERRAAADEFIARRSESINADKNAWQKMIDSVKRFINKMTGKYSIDQYLDDLLESSLARYETIAKKDLKGVVEEGATYRGIMDTSTGTFLDMAAEEHTAFNIKTESTLEKQIRDYAKSKEGKVAGWSEEKIESIIKETQDLINAIHTSSTGNEFYDEFATKDPTIRVDWRDGADKPIVTWTRANIEYKYDMSADLLCINNEGLEEVLSSDKMVALMEVFVPKKKAKKGEPVIKFDADDYLELYNTLRDLGFVVPCKGCFDAAGRFKMLPSVAQKFAAEVNAVIDERNKDPKKFDDALKAKSGDKVPTGLPATASTKSAAIAVGVAGDNLTEHVKWMQLMSADGQTKMLSDWGGIFRAWQRTGAGRPKDKLLPEPYYGDIVSQKTTIIAAYGEKTPSFRDILVNTGTGLRRNSHSEFRPVLAVDEIQFMRDAFIKNLTVFKYMKELDDVRLFGKMGVKYNMSFFPEYVPGTKAAGLDLDGNYIASEESVGSREFPYTTEDGVKHYDGMKGFEEAKKYINKDVSLSSVILSIPHLIKALTDVPTPSDWRGIWGSLIPFHSSGATSKSLESQGLGQPRANGVGHGFDEAMYDYDKGVTNFEAVQNDRFGEGWEIIAGKKAGTKVEVGHKLEFANGTHYYNRGLGVHLFASGYILDSELPAGALMENGDLNLDADQKKTLMHKFEIDYNNKVREINTPYAYKEAADYYLKVLPEIGLIPRFDFNVEESIFLQMCADANVDPRHPKLGWKGEGHGWSPIDSEAYYSVFCDFGMTDPATGELSKHNPVGIVNENGEREFRLPDNVVEIVKDGLERYTSVRNAESSKIDGAIREFARRSVENGRLSKKDAEKIVGKLTAPSKKSGAVDLVEEARKAQAKHDAKANDVRFRVLDTTNAELKEKPIKLNGMYRFKLKNAFKGVKDNGGSYPYIKVQLEEVSDDYSGEKIEYNGILEGFAVVRIPKGLITEGEKDNEFFIDPKAIENELWDVLRATENYYEFKHGGAPYQRDWLNADEVRFRVTPEQDKAYMDAVKAGDMETAQRMVIEAAKLAMSNTKVVDENGNPKIVYHGGSSTFTKFDTSLGDGMTDLGQGSYFSSTEEVAREYTVPNGDNQWQIDSYIEEHPYLREMARTQLGLAEAERIAIREVFKNAKVYPVFLNMENPYYTTMEDFADGEFAHLYNRDGLRGYDGIIDNTFKDRFNNFANGAVQYVAFEPSQIKSADPVTYDDNGNVIPLSERFNPKNSDIRFRVANENQAIFVSNAAKAVEGIKQEKATPEQWLKMIEKNGGLKAGEDKWMGLSDWLKASDKKTLTKAEVLDFINENMIVIEETHYTGDAEDDAASRHDFLEHTVNERYKEILNGLQEIEDYDERRFKAFDLFQEELGEFADLVELDWSGAYLTFSYEDLGDYIEFANRFGVDIKLDNPIHETRLAYTTPGLDDLHEIALTVPTIESWNTSDDIHFGDAGDGRAVAWIRFGETWEQRPSPQISRKVLVIDEIQSKRHQEGREKGYKKSKAEIEQYLSDNGYEVKEDGNFYNFYKNGELERRIAKGLMHNSMDKAKRFYVAALNKDESYNSGIPDAPFDKNWHELAMKRMLRYAAENGYDVIAWTKGAQQNQRYGLSKVVDEIYVASDFASTKREESSFRMILKNGDDNHVGVNKKTGIVTFYNENPQAIGKPLSDLLGKEMADKILAAKDYQTFRGVDFELSEGMKGFYDKMLPAFMNKYGKKWGVKVEDINLPGLEDAAQTMHSIPVTEEMKASVMEGQVMFRVRGENESAMDFHQSMIDAFLAKYEPNAEVKLYPINRETAKEMGVTIDELKKMRGMYLPDEDIIAIFANEEETNGEEVENSLFHESIHKLANFYPYMVDAGKWLWDNASMGSALTKHKDMIEQAYANVPEEARYEEMLAWVLGSCMEEGCVDILASGMPANERDIIEQITNEIGYDIEKESIQRTGRKTVESKEPGKAEETRGESAGEGKNLGEEIRFRTSEITPEVRAEMNTISAIALVNGTYLKAPNGADTNLTPEQWAMVRTKNFIDWFGDWINDPENASKVVDENGEPKVVYHGTPWNPLEEPAGKAVFKSGWFTGMKNRARGYGEPVAVFLNIKNPAYSYDKGKENDTILPENFDLNNTSSFGEFDGFISYIDYPEVPRISEIAKRRIMIMNPENYEDVIKQRLAEKPRGRQFFSVIPKEVNQIKSATDNTGEFSKENDDIRFRMTDSKGNTLTPDQEAFFGNSKAVDKDGNLLVLYHGTPRAGFTEFTSGWFTTSKEDAISYSGDRKGRMFDPNERYEAETLTAGDYRLGYMTFDSEEDRAAFLAEHPEAENAVSEAEFDSMTLQADEEYDDLIAKKPELQKIWKAYREYERERFVDTTIADLLANWKAYTEDDLRRAMLAYDSNANFDSLDDMDVEERKDALVSALRNADEETEGGIADMKVVTRVPRNGEGLKHNDLGNRTYEVYANIEKPYEIDAAGRSSEFESGDVYKAVDEALSNPKYDGVIIRNWRVGRYQHLGDVVVPKNGSQVQLVSNESPAIEASEDAISFRIVTDEQTLDKLNNEPTIKVYRAMQLIDGKLYPPMAGKTAAKAGEKRQWGKPIELGKWEESEERPDLAIPDVYKKGPKKGQQKVDKDGNPKWVFRLDKGNGTTVDAAYNPYFHTSPTPLNDQFSSAQSRPELVTVEVEIPVSELTSGYKADKAKDGVGKMEWKAGVVQSKLSGTRTVILSRWDKPVRIVPDSEVADVIVKMFEGKDIVMPSNVVTPSLRAELESRGVPFVETDNQGNPIEETRFRVTGTPTEAVVAEGLNLSPAQTAELAGNIFAALPEESRKKITDGLNGNILGLQDAILQIPTILALKENWNDEDRAIAQIVSDEVTKMVGQDLTRPFSAPEALWMLYNALNKSADLISAASRALVQSNLGFDAETLARLEEAKEGVRFRTVGDASVNAVASLYNRGSVNVWTRLKESFVDMNASVEKLVKAIERRSGKVAEGFENILLALNQQSSKGLAAMKDYENKYLNPMLKAIRDIMDKTDFKYEDIVRHVILKHGLERNKKLAQRDARAHYQEIYDDIISKIQGMTAAQKRTYLTNAQLRDADAKAELASLQSVDPSILTEEQKAEHKRDLAKARKAVKETEEYLKRAKKIATLSEQEAIDELDKIFEKIEDGTDSVYKELRKNDYSGISSMFYDQLGVDRKNYSTEEQYQSALMAAKADKYSTLADVEAAAAAEVSAFEGLVDTKELWKRINAATKRTLRQQYEANMISKDQYASLRDMFEYYVPLRGFKDNTAEDMYTYYRRPNSTGYTKPILGAEGRKTEAESPFGWIASMAGSAIASNVKNEAKLALYYFVSNRPENGIATLSRTWFVDSGEVDGDGRKIFKPAYPPFSESLSSDEGKAQYEMWQANMRELQKEGKAYESGQRLNLGNAVVNISEANRPEHIVNVKVAGKDYTIIINGNPRAAQAINGDLNIEKTAQDYGLVFGPVLRWMSSVNTSYNPEFWITNFMRDFAFTAMAVTTKEDPAYQRKFFKNYAKAFKVVKMVYQNEKGTIGDSYIENMYKDFVKYGSVTGYTQIKGNEEWEKEIAKNLKSNDPERVRNGKIMKGTRDVFQVMHQFGESLEQVSRFAAFLTSREMGKDIYEAVNDAKEITVNFNRKGSGKMITLEEAKTLTDKNGQPLNQFEQWMAVGLSSIAPLGRRFIMFFNAAIQGLNATYKLWDKNPKRFAGWALAYFAVGLMNAVLHAMMDDDDDYLDIPAYERRNSLMLGGNGAYLKWALPQEARAFYALGDLAVETAMGRVPQKFYEPGGEVGQALSIVTEVLPVNPSEGWKAFMPSIAIPFIELALNEDYKGSPIYNEQKWLTEEEREKSAKWSKAYQNTGKLYTWTARGLNAATGGDKHDAGLINLQPEKMEHLVQSAFGGTIRTADKFINTFMAIVDPEEEWSVRQTPFLNRVLTINDERFRNVYVNEVFDYYKADAEHALSLEKQYIKDRDAKSLDDLRRSDEYQWAKIYGKYKKPLKSIQEKLRVADGTAERKELMKQQDELKKQMIKEISEL